MQLGDSVVFSAVLRRKSRVEHRQWMPMECNDTAGILIGYRTLSNGTTEWDREEGTIYHPTEYINVALIAYSLYRAPIYAPLDKVRKEG